jgi:hypothetical protein
MWRFRKSLKFWPHKVNLSKSIGGRSFCVGQDYQDRRFGSPPDSNFSRGCQMKPSKKQTAKAGKKDAQEPGDSVPVAARVFSNYVLVPVRKQADEKPVGSALHGAGLLVFNDQNQEKVTLRTGFPARITEGCKNPPPPVKRKPERGSGDRG